MMRLMEVLLHGGTQLGGWRTAQIHAAILAAFGLTANAYSLSQLRYDLRKMKARGLLERDGRRYCYRLTEKGTRVAAIHPVPQTRLRPACERAVSPSARGSIHAPCQD